MPPASHLSRRVFIDSLAATGAVALMLPARADAQSGIIAKPIPSSGELVPVVGLGSWITFNVGNDRAARDASADVIREFFAGGGRMIDSSPMYGSSQQVIGYGLEKLGRPPALFSADKVWTSSGSRGPAQIEESRRAWGVASFDLLQVHNLRAWDEHLPTLQRMKAEGKLRYVGITTSEGRRHRAFERVMREHKLDFVQVTYNIVDREVERRILPLAQERGIAVIANRPFQQGDLTARLAGKKLPNWAPDLGCSTWAQFILKFIVSHPALTCAIPATTRVDHVRENIAAARGTLPDAATRRRMAAYVELL